MGFCPSCKLEYVDGVKICPDCKSVLVDKLVDEFDFSEPVTETGYEELAEEGISFSDEEKQAMLERAFKIANTPKYKSRKDSFVEHRSGAYVLILCGIFGIAVLILNALSILKLPFDGSSSILTNIVMGGLFFVFLASGIFSMVKAIKLKPLVSVEEEDTKKAIEFLKDKLSAKVYSFDKEEGYEERYLEAVEKMAQDLDDAFPEFEPGFSTYIVDNYADGLIDEG